MKIRALMLTLTVSTLLAGPGYIDTVFAKPSVVDPIAGHNDKDKKAQNKPAKNDKKADKKNDKKGAGKNIAPNRDPRPLPAQDTVDNPVEATTGGGNSAGSNNSTPAVAGQPKVIARWNTVPYQAFAGTLNVGVLAFHSTGVDRVEFYVNNVLKATVRDMTRNPETDVMEYWTTLTASQYPDGVITVTAKAYPKGAGTMTALQGASILEGNNGAHSLPLYANSRGGLPTRAAYLATNGNDNNPCTNAQPCLTIYRAAMSLRDSGGYVDNAVIYLKAGEYSWAGVPTSAWEMPDTRDAWLTLTPAPGVKRSQARIVAGSETSFLRTKLVRFKNLTVAAEPRGADCLGYDDGGCGAYPIRWYDNCELVGGGKASFTGFGGGGGWSGGTYATDSFVHSARDGFRGGTMFRNGYIYYIASDGGSDTMNVNNVVMWDINPAGADPATDPHPDIIQHWGARRGAIIFNLSAMNGIVDSQGLSAGGGGDRAIVNAATYAPGRSFYEDPRDIPTLDNLYIAYSTILGGTASWSAPEGFTPWMVITNTMVDTSFASPDANERSGISLPVPPTRRPPTGSATPGTPVSAGTLGGGGDNGTDTWNRAPFEDVLGPYPGVTYRDSGERTYNLVVVSPNCPVTRSPNLARYAPGSQVTLTAVPKPGYRFVKWMGGDASGTNPTITVTMARDLGIVAECVEQ